MAKNGEKAGTDRPRPFDAIDAVDKVGLAPSRLREIRGARFWRLRRGVDCVDVRPGEGESIPRLRPVDDIDDADDVDDPRTKGRRRGVRTPATPASAGRPRLRRARRTTRRRADGKSRLLFPEDRGGVSRRLVVPSSCRPETAVTGGNPPPLAAASRNRTDLRALVGPAVGAKAEGIRPTRAPGTPLR